VNDRSDQQLLQDYAQNRSETAFAVLVRRHLDLVYSAALRRLGDAHLAEDVAQGTFSALAQNAPGLAGHPVLSGWLHRTTQNLAANLIRTNLRRQTREQEAVTMNQLLSSAPDDVNWQSIAPHLDAALDELESPDRDVVMLRYFEKKSAREAAVQLGLSEAAAQKRVSRAVDRLREFFAKRGVTVGTSGLAVVISAHAVQAAPVGLAITISTAAAAPLTGTTLATTATVTAAKTIAMTALQKTVVTATIAVLAGAGIYEARQASQLREQVHSLQKQQAPLSDQIQQLQTSLADATNRLAELFAETARLKSPPRQNELLKLRGEVARLKNETNDESAMNEKFLNEKVKKLRARLAADPSAGIPEMQFLTDQDWLKAAGKKLETDADFRRAMASLRSMAESKFARGYRTALQRYLDSNSKQFPTNLSVLRPYFKPAIDEAILQRWKLIPAKGEASPGFSGGDWVLTQVKPVDEVFDDRFTIGLNGVGTTEFFFFNDPQISINIGLMQKAYYAANPPTLSPEHAPTASDLSPYADTPEKQAVIQQMMMRESAQKSLFISE
jgi:RNA polymerase sigma factor (sigma-70 family)